MSLLTPPAYREVSIIIFAIKPEFSEEPIETDEGVNNWLRFYDVKSPLTCLSVLISHDPVS